MASRAYKSTYAAHATLSVAMLPPVHKTLPVCTGYNVTSDKASSILKFYAGDIVTTYDAISNTGQAVLAVTSTTGFANGDTLMQLTSAGVCSWIGTVLSIQAGISLTLNANVPATTVVGDRVFSMVNVGQIPCGAATISAYANALGIFGGNASKPIAATLDSTSSGKINIFAATYEPWF